MNQGFITLTVRPFVHRTAGGYQPGVEFGIKGQNPVQEVLALTFMDEATTLTFARKFANDRMEMMKEAVKTYVKKAQSRL